MEQNSIPKNWYVAYTYSHAERSVLRCLEKMHIVCFLPLHKVIRHWHDRKKKIETPFFPNYIFIYSFPHDRYKALQVKGIVKYVSFEGKHATIKNEQIETIKRMLKGDVEFHHGEHFKPGTYVRITEGPFVGFEGNLAMVNGNMRLVVQINCLNRSISVNIPSNIVSPILQNA